MISINQNKALWGDSLRWKHEFENGDRWSSAWGGVDMQWYGSILPRIQKYLKDNRSRLFTSHILEIASGYGRWTQFLLNHCELLSAVDLNENCSSACRERFHDVENIRCYTNNGLNLDMIPSSTVDFVFSFDSLVHVEEDVIQSYLKEIKRILKVDGIGFIHHSNLGQYKGCFRFKKIRDHGRALSVSADKFKKFCNDVDLICLSQEITNWGNPARFAIDCYSVLTQQGSKFEQKYQFLETDFHSETSHIKKLSALYY